MKRILKWFIPQELKFFGMLANQSDNLLKGAKVFNRFVKDFEKLSKEERKELSKKIKNIEKKGDDITHNITDELNRSFLTPFDKEDIHQLTDVMDNVLDFINGTSKRMILYDIESIMPETKELNSIILECVEEINLSVNDLQKLKNISHHSIKINTLENKADVITDRGIAALFKNNSNDAIKIIKHKEILELMEKVTDECEHLMNIFDSIVVKHA